VLHGGWHIPGGHHLTASGKRLREGTDWQEQRGKEKATVVSEQLHHHLGDYGKLSFLYMETRPSGNKGEYAGGLTAGVIRRHYDTARKNDCFGERRGISPLNTKKLYRKRKKSGRINEEGEGGGGGARTMKYSSARQQKTLRVKDLQERKNLRGKRMSDSSRFKKRRPRLWEIGAEQQGRRRLTLGEERFHAGGEKRRCPVRNARKGHPIQVMCSKKGGERDENKRGVALQEDMWPRWEKRPMSRGTSASVIVPAVGGNRRARYEKKPEEKKKGPCPRGRLTLRTKKG